MSLLIYKRHLIPLLFEETKDNNLFENIIPLVWFQLLLANKYILQVNIRITSIYGFKIERLLR